MKKAKKILLFIIFLLCFVITPFVYGRYTSKYDIPITLNVSKPVYTITFHSNYGNDTTEVQNFTYGTSQTLRANTFTRTNYLFVEWNTESDGSGTSYSNQQSVNKLTPRNNDNIDLYAQWRRELTFTVTGNPTTWQNTDATLTIVPDYPDTYQYSFDGGTTWQNTSSFTFSSNQTVNMKIKSLDGFISNLVTENITKIDKIAPSINFSSNSIIVTLDESNPINTIATASDNESGVDTTGLQVHRYVVATARTTDLITNTNYFTYPGLYAIELEVSDVAGNTTSLNSQILVRWPTAGKYVVRRTELDNLSGGVLGTGKAIDGVGSGLYQDDASTGYQSDRSFASKYYYSGPSVNNYIYFGGYTYNVLNVSVNDDIKVIGEVSSRNIRWSSRKIFSSNQYTDWQTWWSGKYLYYSNDGQYRTFTDTDISHIDEAEFYAGRFTKSDTPTLLDTIEYERLGGSYLKDGEDVYPAYFNGHFAFPNVSDYIKACNRQDIIYNIQTTQDNTSIFKSNSWLSVGIGAEQWTMNSKNDTTTDNDFWVLDPTIANNNRIVSRTYYYYENYRPVFYLKYDTILSGTGTNDDPFNVEEDWSWFDNVQVLQ